MAEFKVFRSPQFNEEIKQLSNHLIDRIVKIEEQLKTNPFAGKPLGYKWFREKKLGKFRVYFLIYEELNAVYLVLTSDKKTQQKTISQVKLLFNNYREEIENMLKETI
ncbi:MAG: hypothetical protein Q7S21_01900 [archaeon]|nr:hypothetical protein [archaeon]